MNFAEDKHYAGKYIIKSYVPGEGFIVNDQNYASSLIVNAEQLIPWRPHRLADITADDMQSVLQLPPSLLIWGSGAKFQWPDQSWSQLCADNKFDIEIMTSRSACGTFNMLLTDKRQVTAILMLD